MTATCLILKNEKVIGNSNILRSFRLLETFKNSDKNKVFHSVLTFKIEDMLTASWYFF